MFGWLLSHPGRFTCGLTQSVLQLIPDLSGGIDPDDSFSKVPYERGFYFLTYLQQVSSTVHGYQKTSNGLQIYPFLKHKASSSHKEIIKGCQPINGNPEVCTTSFLACWSKQRVSAVGGRQTSL